MLLLALLLAAPPPPPPPGAGTPPPAPGPTLARARAMAETTLAACAAKGFDIAVSVVDSAGKAKVTLSADGFGGNPATSVKKGAVAALYKAKGSAIEARIATDAALAAAIAAKPDQLNAHAGSVPILSGGAVIGGIGVTGAPGHDDDEVCAEAGLAAR